MVRALNLRSKGQEFELGYVLSVLSHKAVALLLNKDVHLTSCTFIAENYFKYLVTLKD